MASLDLIPHDYLVFDLVDDLSAYQDANSERASTVARDVMRLVRDSDLVIVTAQTLFDRCQPTARQLVHIPNGFDAQTFSVDGVTGRSPEALDDIPRPILGFIGTIFTLLDFELLEYVARMHTDKSLVLVGPVEASAAPALAHLTRLPNVFHVSPQPQALIPSFVAQFDVCLNPFRPGAVADSVSPLKVYEYLAMGRPVVSARMASLEMEEAGQVIAFGSDAKAFSDEVHRSLSEDVQRDTMTRTNVAAAYSWDRLFATLTAACEEMIEE